MHSCAMPMIRPLLLLAVTVCLPHTVALAQQPLDPGLDRARYDGCVRAIPTDAQKAELFAVEWHARGGGLPARHCEALAQLHQERFAAAAQTLGQAAEEAAKGKSALAADLYGQAGNAAFLASDLTGARIYFDRALELVGEFAPARRTALLVDRARVLTEQSDFTSARHDLDAALALAPKDPMVWMLSAALARRQGDISRASRDIAQASEFDSSNPDIMFEQGNVAAANGDRDGARRAWELVVKAAPGTPAADLAAKALAAN